MWLLSAQRRRMARSDVWGEGRWSGGGKGLRLGVMGAHLRAVLVLAHLLAITVAACPAPRGLRRADLSSAELSPVVQVFAALSAPLVPLGLPAAGEARVWALSQSMLSARGALLRPLQPYFQLAGCEQGWAMFGTLNHRPGRLEIWGSTAAEGEGAWEPLYIAADPDHDWNARVFRQERMRAWVNPLSWRRSRDRLARLADWVAAEVAASPAHADLVRVRVQMRTMPLPDPATLRAVGRVVPGEPYWSEDRELSR